MKISIRGKLLLTFTVILLLMSIVWSVDYYTRIYLANEVTRIYTHPLAVTRASLKANSHIMAMHRSMKDVVLASNDEELNSAIALVDDLEKEVFDELVIVQERILGAKGKKLAADTYNAFKDWRAIRQEVINLVQVGKMDEAIAITKGKGADHVTYLDEKAEELWKYAENKGRTFNLEAHEYVKSSSQKNILVFFTAILFSSSLAIYISFSISSRLKQLKAAVKEVAEGHLNQSVRIKGGDEIAELGEEFNRMAIQLSDSYSSLKHRTGELVKSNEQLEREISERRQAEEDLITAKEEAERANIAKSTFLSSMSHEIRTPLTSVIGFSKLLQSDTDRPLTDSQKELSTRIADAGDHLLELVDGVLDLSKIESEKIALSFEDVDVELLVRTAMDALAPLAEKYRVKLTFANGSEHCYVRADRTHLLQALINLISNAIKYNKRGGEVVLSCELSGEKTARISLSDTGPGIAEDKIGNLFKPFDRLGKEGQNIPGTGIGLTITKRLVESMGGEVGLKSKVGKGSMFYIDIPIAYKLKPEVESSAVDTAEPAFISKELAGAVLYIEDNKDNVELVKLMLKDWRNIELFSSKRAEDGIKIATTLKPNLILMDIGLPGMDGFEALKRLRRLDETRRIPVIVISARAMKHEVEAGKAAGFDDYITKPINADQLHRALDRLLA